MKMTDTVTLGEGVEKIQFFNLFLDTKNCYYKEEIVMMKSKLTWFFPIIFCYYFEILTFYNLIFIILKSIIQ